MNPLKLIDDWWDRTAPMRRLDRNAANLFLLTGLVLTSLSVIIVGASPSSVLNDMTNDMQVAMCTCIFGGCLVKLFGAVAHSRFFFPRIKLKTCYQIGVAGAPLASSGMFVYGWFLLENVPTWTSAMSAVLTPLLGAGILVQAMFYLLEARRIGRNEAKMIHEAKQVVREQRMG